MQISLAKWTALGGTVASALFLAGCGALHPQDLPIEAPARTASAAPGNVSKKLLGSSWPLEVESGSVACETKGKDVALTFATSEGKVYALNGIATVNYPPLSAAPGKSLGGLISQAFATCEVKGAGS